MDLLSLSPRAFSSAWEVLLLFLIPIGGGIPAGVLLARNRGLDWPVMMALYFISDVILALLFEPLMWLVMLAARRIRFLGHFIATFRATMNQSIAKYGVNPGPISLISISFGIDPMTGRTAARAAGHRFVSGWALAISGDMIFFTILMVSTLWLDNILGDGTWTAIMIMLGMVVIPIAIRRVRGWMNAAAG